MIFRSILYCGLVLSLSESSAAESRKARHDPPDQVFRRAAMAESSRSIVINLAANLHLAFDPDLCRIHTVWVGGPLNLWGPPYSYSKSPFICDFDGKEVFSLPQRSMWSNREARFKALETSGRPALVYRIGRIEVRETLSGNAAGDEWQFSRALELSASAGETVELLVAAEPGGEARRIDNTVQVSGPNGSYSIVSSGEVQWRINSSEADYFTETITEAGTEKGNPRKRYQGPETRVFVQFQPGVRKARLTYANTMRDLLAGPVESSGPVIFQGGKKRPDSGDEFYRIEHFPLPTDAEMIVTGLDALPNGDLVLCTWLGEVFIVQNAVGAIELATYRRIARGLNEPLGILQQKGNLYVVQKGELTRLEDTNNDGEIDRFECVSADWGYSGNYHSYSFGPVPGSGDSLLVFVTGQRGRADLHYQGHALRIDPETGEADSIADGLRVPHGTGLFQGDVFVTDNQGNWIGTCRLNHIRPGHFYGFPSSLPSPKGPRSAGEVTPPALWLPRALSPSASGFDTVTDERFGPFKGQMLIGDFQNAIIMRAFLEQVNGQWQGVVFPFAKGFLSGINRLEMNRDGKLYVGGGKRTWSTAAPSEWSLDRVSFTGKMPFEVKEVRAESDGFTLSFTKPLEAEYAKDPESYLVKQFGYRYHSDYGSPEFDQEGQPGATELAVETARLSQDALSVRLVIPGLRKGYVTAFQLAVTSKEDEDLRHNAFFYTLNEIPGR